MTPANAKPPVLAATEDEAQKVNDSLDEHNFVAEKYSKFLSMYTAWQMRLPVLGGRTALEFWNDSTRDYAVLATEFDDPNDPVEQYQSTISRDQTNTVYANHLSKSFRPSCVAQNSEQSIDRTLAKVGDTVLEWAYKQDGWPSESGQQKLARVIHKCCVQGTAYSLDVVTEDGLDSQLLPNEEIYYPNLWQPNIQLQSRVYRVRLNMDKGEAEEEFGEFDAWKDVDTSGGWTSAFIIQYPELKGMFDGIVQADKISVMYTWERASQSELKDLKRKRKVSKSAKRAWYYNVIVNNVAMFPVDNVSPYKSGILPISKIIFEPMAETEFALGNSVPNKCMEDKKWTDAWKTNLRWRGKLNAMPPQLVIGGHLNGEEVMLPSAFTSVPQGVVVQNVPGFMPISTADIELMNMAKTDIERSTIEPVAQGSGDAARTAMIQQANAQTMLEPFSQQLAFFVASRSFHILMASFDLLTKSKLAKLAVPDQTLDDGLTGTFEVLFKEPEDVLTSEVPADKVKSEMDAIKAAGVNVKEADLRRLMHSFQLKKAADQSRKSGTPVDTIYISPSYVAEAKFYIFSDAADAMQDKDATAQMKYSQDLPLMLNDKTGSLVPSEVWREFVRMRGYNERILQTSNPNASAPQPQQNPQQPGGTPASASAFAQPPSSPNQTVDAAAAATGVPSPGKLPGV